ncbi:MAG: NAD-dependent protein deacylase [Dehalococcoidia bacterium]
MNDPREPHEPTSDEAFEEAIEEAGALLAVSRHVVALSGAGISKESGIPTYRGEGGLWTLNGEPPMNQFQTFADDPARWWQRRLEDAPGDFARAIDAAEPNPGHHALAELESLGILAHLITQNVDDLHRRAGQRSLTEIHGNRHWMRCLMCGMRWPRAEYPVYAHELPPRCDVEGCHGVVKSDTVMFGEPIPPAALQRCAEETWQADVFMVVGTTGVVYPAAGYPIDAARRGVPLIEVNPEQTGLTDLASIVVRAPAGEALPAIVEAVKRHRAAPREHA